MIAEYLTECGVEQMDGAVIARGCGAALRVYFESHFVSCGEGAAFNMADVQIYAVRLFCIGHCCFAVFTFDYARIAYLTAAFTVETCRFCDDYCAFARNVGRLVSVRINDGDYFAFVLCLFIARKYGFFKFGEEGLVLPAAYVSSCGSCTGFLFVKTFFVAFLVYSESSFCCDLTREIYRETECIGKLENICAVEHFCSACLCFFGESVKKVHPCFDVCVKAFFFHRNYLAYIVELFGKFGICGEIFVRNDSHYIGKERAFYSEKLAVTARAAEKSAKNVASAFV